MLPQPTRSLSKRPGKEVGLRAVPPRIPGKADVASVSVSEAHEQCNNRAFDLRAEGGVPRMGRRVFRGRCPHAPPSIRLAPRLDARLGPSTRPRAYPAS